MGAAAANPYAKARPDKLQNMPSRVFAAYAEEHAELCASAGRSIAQLRELMGADRKATQSEAESTLSKAEELVQQMELEARSNGAKGPEAKELQARAKACKSEVGALRTSLRQAAVSVPGRSELLGGSSGDEDERARLVRMGENNARLQGQTSKLQAAQRVINDTEQIGENILGDLRSQREVITHATGTLQRANEGLARSRRTLDAIRRYTGSFF